MSTLFAYLFLAVFGMWIWGLISPRGLSRLFPLNFTRRSAGFGLGLLAFGLLLTTGLTAPKSSLTATPKSAVAASAIQALPKHTESKLPTVTTKTMTETQPIPFTSTTAQDATMAQGSTKVTTTGVDGVKTLTYKVTYTNGKQTAKELVSEVVTTAPINQVTSVGTYVKPAAPKTRAAQPTCDPNYTGACVPNVYPDDVDCGGGTGNGPYYVYGTVHVIGVDRYNLDGDGNGIGCQ